MNQSEAVTTVVLSTLSLLLICVMAFKLYREYRVDAFREELFTIRDALFDVAVDGEVGFRDPAYELLRTTLNGFIRFGDRITLTSCILLYWKVGPYIRSLPADQTFAGRFRHATSELDPVTAKKLQDLLARTNQLVLEHVVLSSPVLLLTFVPAVVARAASRELLRRTDARRWLRTLDSVAFEFGTPGGMLQAA